MQAANLYIRRYSLMVISDLILTQVKYASIFSSQDNASRQYYLKKNPNPKNQKPKKPTKQKTTKQKKTTTPWSSLQ